MRLVTISAACIAAILSSSLNAGAQHYYVVVGAFAAGENAGEFKGYLPGQATDTFYTNADMNNLLHFYVLKTSDKESAISKSIQLKKQIEAWRKEKDDHLQPVPEEGVSGSLSMNLSPATNPESAAVENVASESKAASGAVSGVLASAGKVPPPPVGKYFKFKIQSAEEGPIPAKVHHVDFNNGLELAAYNSNTFVDLRKPGYTDKPMAVVCGIFGYKEIHKYIDYANPSLTDDEAFVNSQGAWVIPYNLERVEAGDVSVMYNVSFYKDAVVMRKPSQTDLDELVRMMHSNPYYEITIHAHCNGKKKRKIIALGPEKNYFDVSGSITVTGSAKDLTTLRAQAIRSYLAEHGIDPDRTKIFAWGGSDMLIRPDDPHANLNDRIEIEFTRD